MAGNENSGRLKTLDLTDPKIIGELTIFGKIASTQIEMADYWGVCRQTIANYMKDEDGIFFNTYTNAKATLHKSLRSAQVKKALKGDNQMLIWLGKNILGQEDKTAVDHTTKGKGFASFNLMPPKFLGQDDPADS